MNVDSWQIDAEQKVRELKTLLDEGHITQGEYEELVQDVIDLNNISENLDLEDNKIKAQKAVDAIMAIAGLL